MDIDGDCMSFGDDATYITISQHDLTSGGSPTTFASSIAMAEESSSGSEEPVSNVKF